MSGAKIDPATVKYLRRYWFRRVQELSDLELQRRTWLDLTNTNPHWSYVEFTCSYPDEDQLASAHAEGWLTEREFELLRNLGGAVDLYSAPGDDDYNHEAILNDPTWHAFVEVAEQARQQLLAVIVDTDERKGLLGAVDPDC